MAWPNSVTGPLHYYNSTMIYLERSAALLEGRFARERETDVFLAGAPCNHLRPPCSPLFGSLLSQVGSPVGKPLKILGFPAALFCRLSLYFSLLPGSAARRRPVPPDCVRPADALIRRGAGD